MAKDSKVCIYIHIKSTKKSANKPIKQGWHLNLYNENFLCAKFSSSSQWTHPKKKKKKRDGGFKSTWRIRWLNLNGGKNSLPKLLTPFPVLPATMQHAVGNAVTPRKKREKMFIEIQFQYHHKSA